MSNPADFVIENGVLKKYVGPGGDVVIPEGVTDIGTYAFAGCESLASVTIPDGVTKIGACAFYGCKSLAFVIIPESVREIGDWLFSGCDALESVHTGSKEVFDLLWKKLSEAKKLRILSEVLREQSAESFHLPKIKANKKKLLSLAIQRDDEEIVSRLFALYKKIPLEELDEAIKEGEGAPKVTFYLLSYKEANYTVEIQEKIAEISTEKELGLRERTLSDWKRIYGLGKCEGGICIKNYMGDELDILIPEKIGKEKVVAIGKGAFSPEGKRITKEQKELRSRLTSVVIPDSVTEIGEMAFSDCKSLVSVTIPEGVTDIGGYAFDGCESLASVVIPDSVTKFGNAAFAGCESLASVKIPEGVREIADCAFNGCESLASVTIPKGVRKIGDLAFCGCDSLSSITIPGSVKVIADGTFEYCHQFTIHAPSGSFAEKYAKENNIPFVAE